MGSAQESSASDLCTQLSKPRGGGSVPSAGRLGLWRAATPGVGRVVAAGWLAATAARAATGAVVGGAAGGLVSALT
jgi:hypothetical protein